MKIAVHLGTCAAVHMRRAARQHMRVPVAPQQQTLPYFTWR